ncbi:MAG: PAS domain S-box protein [Deltaproteobacteria bacterium]|nr:PAS domain S-box protein [Deltaproteobacteria bacterium]MDQ3295329.1 PAS domain S-box protein [Myxococcota bacterium]
MRALVIGVDADRTSGIARALGEQAHEAAFVADTAHGLALVESAAAPLIVLQQKADLDAAAACRALRNAPATASSVILVMLAASDATLIQSVLGAGADDFFFDTPGDLAFRARLRVVRRALELGTSSRHATEDVDVLFEVALELLCIAGLDGRFRRVSPSWTTTLGWSAEELCARPWLEFVHPDDQQQTVEAGMQLSAGATLIAFANRYRCRDGSYRWLEWRVVPSVERGLIYACARDVTANRAQQEALRELAESLSTTLSSIGDGVISVDLDGAIVRMNPVAEQLTGWTERAACTRAITDVFQIIDAETRALVADPVAIALRENRVVALASDTLLVRRDGTEVAIADSCAPIRNADGSVSGAVLVFRDMTAELVAKQVTEHARRQLVFSDRMAAVGSLAAGIAHEINNPLSYITANLDLVIEEIQEMGGGSSSERMLELENMVQDAQKGADRIKKLVRGMKTFSRLEEERRTVTSVTEVMDLAINMTFSEIRHRSRVVKDYKEVPRVQADDARLGQVFMNLLVNAAHSIPVGDMDNNEIRISTSTDAKGRAVIEVHDTGAGIPASQLERIFDPFFTTKPVGVGTGLGLSICHNIITGMHGEIAVESTVGKGSRFTVVLPAASPEDIAAAAVPSSTRIPVIKQRASILIVDDEPAVGITLSRVLREHHVTTYTRALDALELLCTGKHFDVIFSDLMMPGMSGIEFYEQLVVRCPSAVEKVVFISGAFSAETDEFLDRIPNERLEKPFDAKTVREVVQRFVT